MTDAHKAALAVGREEGRAVRRYLEAIEATKPRRGRRPSKDRVKKRLGVLEQEIADAPPLGRLHLVQEQRDLQALLVQRDQPVDLATLEKDFIKAAKPYGERKGIAYATWRAAGVASTVLAKAGIGR